MQLRGKANLYKNFAGLNGIRSPEKTAENMESKSQAKHNLAAFLLLGLLLFFCWQK